MRNKGSHRSGGGGGGRRKQPARGRRDRINWFPIQPPPCYSAHAHSRHGIPPPSPHIRHVHRHPRRPLPPLHRCVVHQVIHELIQRTARARRGIQRRPLSRTVLAVCMGTDRCRPLHRSQRGRRSMASWICGMRERG